MMRTTTLVKVLLEEYNFIDLIYYDGIKLQVDVVNYSLLVWYDYEESSEKWFKVQSNEKNFKLYISNKISLLKVLQNSEVFMIERDYSNYNLIEKCIKVDNLEKYELPDSEAYLGFDFTEEKEYSYHLFSKYKKHALFNQGKIVKKEVKDKPIKYKNRYNEPVEWRIDVAA